jgi:hypothetical protein
MIMKSQLTHGCKVKSSNLRTLLGVTDHVGGSIRLGDRVVNSGDVGSNAGDDLGANLSLGLGEDTGAGVSDRLEGDDAGENVEVVSELSGHGACQAGGGSNGLGSAVDDSVSLGVVLGSLGVVSNRLETVVDVLTTADPFPRVTGDGSSVLAVVESNVVTDAERRSAVEVDDAGTVPSALLVAEDQNRAWLRASDLAVVVCTLDGSRERKERLVERVAVTLNLGVSVAVLGTVAVEVVGRNNGDVVPAVLNADRSGGDGQVVLVTDERVHPGWIDVSSTSPLHRTSWDTLGSGHGEEFETGRGVGCEQVVGLFDENCGIVVKLVEVLGDGTVVGAVGVAEGCQDTTEVFPEESIVSFDESGTQSCEGGVGAETLVGVQEVITAEGGDVAVLAVTVADVDLVPLGGWSRPEVKGLSGASGRGSGRDGRTVASDGDSSSDGNGSGDGGRDAEELCDGQ